MQEELIPDEYTAPEQFVIDSVEKVEWLLRRLRNIRTERDCVKAQADSILRSLECAEKGLLFRFEEDLKAFTANLLKETGSKAKSVKLLQGTLGFRTVPAGLKLTDESDAKRCAVSEGFETCFVEQFVPAAYRELAEKRLEASGELLPGVELQLARESFSIRFGKGTEE